MLILFFVRLVNLFVLVAVVSLVVLDERLRPGARSRYEARDQDADPALQLAGPQLHHRRQLLPRASQTGTWQEISIPGTIPVHTAAVLLVLMLPM